MCHALTLSPGRVQAVYSQRQISLSTAWICRRTWLRLRSIFLCTMLLKQTWLSSSSCTLALCANSAISPAMACFLRSGHKYNFSVPESHNTHLICSATTFTTLLQYSLTACLIHSFAAHSRQRRARAFANNSGDLQSALEKPPAEYCLVTDPDVDIVISDTTVNWISKQSQRLVAHSRRSEPRVAVRRQGTAVVESFTVGRGPPHRLDKVLA